MLVYERNLIRETSIMYREIVNQQTQDDDGGCAVSYLLVLGAADLNHGLGSWVLHLDLSHTDRDREIILKLNMELQTLEHAFVYLSTKGVSLSKCSWDMLSRTLTSLRMALPSLVITMPPMGSSSICPK